MNCRDRKGDVKCLCMNEINYRLCFGHQKIQVEKKGA